MEAPKSVNMLRGIIAIGTSLTFTGLYLIVKYSGQVVVQFQEIRLFDLVGLGLMTIGSALITASLENLSKELGKQSITNPARFISAIISLGLVMVQNEPYFFVNFFTYYCILIYFITFAYSIFFVLIPKAYEEQ